MFKNGNSFVCKFLRVFAVPWLCSVDFANIAIMVAIFQPNVTCTTPGLDGGGARSLGSRDGVMTASEFEKLYRSPAASLVSSLPPLISPVCCIEYGSPIGVTAQADRKPYSSITAKQAVHSFLNTCMRIIKTAVKHVKRQWGQFRMTINEKQQTKMIEKVYVLNIL